MSLGLPRSPDTSPADPAAYHPPASEPRSATRTLNKLGVTGSSPVEPIGNSAFAGFSVSRRTGRGSPLVGCLATSARRISSAP